MYSLKKFAGVVWEPAFLPGFEFQLDFWKFRHADRVEWYWAQLVLDEASDRLYVWNHFEAALSVVDLNAAAEIDRIAVFNPLPAAIRQGRALLYDTHRTSGLGQASCGSCHIAFDPLHQIARRMGLMIGRVQHQQMGKKVLTDIRNGQLRNPG